MVEKCMGWVSYCLGCLRVERELQEISDFTHHSFMTSDSNCSLGQVSCS